MARILFLFLDGVGLGAADPATNPFARAQMPHLYSLLGGRQLVIDSVSTAPASSRATLLALDACLGVPGLPQSATGQAALLTGINVPAELGHHYGPKPDPEVAAFLKNGSVFSQIPRVDAARRCSMPIRPLISRLSNQVGGCIPPSRWPLLPPGCRCTAWRTLPRGLPFPQISPARDGIPTSSCPTLRYSNLHKQADG